MSLMSCLDLFLGREGNNRSPEGSHDHAADLIIYKTVRKGSLL